MTGAAVLVIAPAWVGDAVMAQCLLRQLRDDGATRIEVVAPPATAPVLERMAEVDGVHVLDAPHGRLALGARRQLAARLRGRFGQALVLPNSLKSALLPWLAGIAERRGWRGEWRYGLLTDVRRLDPVRWPRMIDRFVALAGPRERPATLPAGLPDTLRPRLRIDPDNQSRCVAGLGLDRDRPVLALCPGAEFGPAKRWPPEAFAQLAAARLAAGDAAWLFGSPGDRATCAAIVAAVHAAADPALHARLHDLSGRTRLADAVDLLALADAVVSNDSGLMHVAGAVDVPVVAIYGSTSPDFTPPLARRQRIVRLDLPCAPCFQRTCPLGHLDCLRTLGPGPVAQALSALRAAPGAVA